MNVLVYQIGSLGDTIVLIPSLRAVRAHFGRDAHIAVLHNVNHAGLVTTREVLECTPLVDEFIPYQFEEPFHRCVRAALSLHRQLRARCFHAVVSLLPSERSALALRRDVLFFRSCGIPRAIGFQTVPDSVVRPRTAGRAMPTRNEALILLQRLRDSGIPADDHEHLRIPLLQPGPADRTAAAAWLAARRRYPERPLVALCPGCKKPANSWPLERFIELGRRIQSTGSAELVILGGPTDRALAAQFGPEMLNAAGEFSVAGSAAILSQCCLLIGLDTGTTHLAAAVGVPCIAIQSANSYAGHWDPLGASHTVIRHEPPCAGCLCTECPVAGHPCMTNISIDEVWQIVARAIVPAAGCQAASHARA